MSLLSALGFFKSSPLIPNGFLSFGLIEYLNSGDLAPSCLTWLFLALSSESEWTGEAEGDLDNDVPCRLSFFIFSRSRSLFSSFFSLLSLPSFFFLLRRFFFFLSGDSIDFCSNAFNWPILFFASLACSVDLFSAVFALDVLSTVGISLPSS